MCLISILKKGTEKYSDEVLEFIKKGMENNTQGTGFMFKRNGENKITLSKGYYNSDVLIDCLKRINLTIDDELVIHHRIASVGDSSLLNCHPFVVSNIDDEINSHEIITDKPCLAHNGTFRWLTEFRNHNNNTSDTYTFVKEILSDNNILNLLKDNKPLFKKLFKDIINTSRVVIMYPDKDLEIIGDFVECNTYYHSNNGFKTSTRNVGGVEYSLNNYYGHNNMGYVQKDSITDRNTNNKRSDDKKKGKFRLLLDGKFIKLTKLNCSHFSFVEKKHWEVEDNRDNLRLYEINSFDGECLINNLSRYNGQHKICIGILTSSLYSDYYYIPKPEYEKIYRDYIKLISMDDSKVGKSTIQKLNTLINKGYNKPKLFTVEYHKLGDKVTVEALKDYKEYLFTRYPKLRPKEYEIITDSNSVNTVEN